MAMLQPRRIMLLNNFYPPHVVGGAEVIVTHLAQWLAAQGNAVTVVTTCAPGQDGEDVGEDGVRVIRFFPSNLWWNHERFQPGDQRSAARKVIWNLRDQWNQDALRRLGQLLDQVQPDVMHTHNLKGFSLSVWEAARRRRIPIVHTAHDYHLLCNRGIMLRAEGPCVGRCAACRLGKLPAQLLARLVDCLVAPSHFVLDQHLKAGIKGRRSSAVIRNGIPARTGRQRVGGTGPLRLLFLGQVRREKGADLLPGLLDALGPGEAVLDVVGAGASEPGLAAAARRDDRLRLTGFLSGQAKEAALEQADVLLFPSLWAENAPISLAEAMSAGLPVIASAIGAVPEFITPGRSGLLVPPGDVPALAQAVRRVQQEQGLLETLSEGALHAAKPLTIDVMGAEYSQTYASTAGSPASSQPVESVA